MNYNEFLNEYLDGTLSEAEQQVFFSALADNAALRHEFNDEILVRTAVRSSIIAEAPPADLTNAIFSAVGYSGNTTVGAGAAIGTSGIVKTGGYLLTFIAGCVAIWLWNPWGNSTSVSQGTTLSTNQYKNQNSSRNSTTTQASNSSTTSANSHNNNLEQKNDRTGESIQFNTAVADIHQLNRASKNYRNRFRLSALESKNDQTSNSHFANPEAPNDLPVASAIQTNPAKPVDEMSASNHEVITNTAILSSPKTELSLRDSYSPIKQSELIQKEPTVQSSSSNYFIFSIRSLQSIPNTEDIASNNTIGINNIAAALLYKINTNISIGLEGGREPFYQEFTHITDSSTELIKQNPTLSWAGPVVRLVMPTWGWNEMIYPFVQAGGGIAESGVYAYGTAGICFVPFDRVSMNLGGGYTRLQYTAYDNQYSTGKVGWSYSMNIHF